MKTTLLATGILVAAMVLVTAACSSPITPVGAARGGLTADATAPTVGTDIVASNTTYKATRLTWGKASDDTTPEPSLQYRLLTASSAAALATLALVDALPSSAVVMDWNVGYIGADISGLSASTTYYYTLEVRDLAGNKALYPTLSVTTSALPPGIVMDGGKDALYNAGVAGAGNSWGAQLGSLSTYSDGSYLYVYFDFAVLNSGNNIYLMVNNTALSPATGQNNFGTDFNTGWGNIGTAGAPVFNSTDFHTDFVAWGARDGSGVFNNYAGAKKIISGVGTDVKSTVTVAQSGDNLGYEFKIPYAAIQGASGNNLKLIVLFGQGGNIHSTIPSMTGTAANGALTDISASVPCTLN
jgi:hypothetical protein